MVQSCIFPDPLKLADVSPVYKDGTSSSKSNYRHISVLSAFSKVFEHLLKRQRAPFMEPKLANIIYGFRDRNITQHVLLRVIETMMICYYMIIYYLYTILPFSIFILPHNTQNSK